MISVKIVYDLILFMNDPGTLLMIQETFEQFLPTCIILPILFGSEHHSMQHFHVTMWLQIASQTPQAVYLYGIGPR